MQIGQSKPGALKQPNKLLPRSPSLFITTLRASTVATTYTVPYVAEGDVVDGRRRRLLAARGHGGDAVVPASRRGVQQGLPLALLRIHNGAHGVGTAGDCVGDGDCDVGGVANDHAVHRRLRRLLLQHHVVAERVVERDGVAVGATVALCLDGQGLRLAWAWVGPPPVVARRELAAGLA